MAYGNATRQVQFKRKFYTVRQRDRTVLIHNIDTGRNDNGKAIEQPCHLTCIPSSYYRDSKTMTTEKLYHNRDDRHFKRKKMPPFK